MQNLANEVANNSPPSATVVDSESEQLSKDYKLHVVRHQRLERYVRALIDSQLAVSDVKGYVIDGRIKDHDGVIKKCLSRGYKSVLQLSDFCGLRVIAQSLEDCERVSWILRTEFEIDVYKSEDKTGEAAATGFGYRSIHLILQLSQPRLAHLENREFTGLTFEIQVRTFLQHGWAEASRDMYKPKNGTPLSAEARRDLTRAAAQLETADELLSRVVSGSKLEPRISLIRQESATEAIPEIGIQISGDSLTNLPVRNSADGSESSRDAIVLFFNSSIAVTQVDTETGLASCQSFVTVDEVPTIKRVSARPHGSNGLVFLGLFE